MIINAILAIVIVVVGIRIIIAAVNDSENSPGMLAWIVALTVLMTLALASQAID